MEHRLASLTAAMHKGGIFYSEAMAVFRKAFITVALRENHGNLSRTAPTLGMHRNSLTRLCLELEIDARQFRTSSRRPPVSAQHPCIAKRTVR